MYIMSDLFKKPKNIFNENSFSINPNKNYPKFKNPITLSKGNKERNNKLKKNEMWNLYKVRNINKYMSDEKKKEIKYKQKETLENNLHEIYKNRLKDEKNKAKIRKRESFILLYQTGTLKPQNLFELRKEIPKLNYDLENINDDIKDEDDVETKNDIENYIKKNTLQSVGSGIFKDNMAILNTSYIDKKYHEILAILNINIPVFFTLQQKFLEIEEDATYLRQDDIDDGEVDKGKQIYIRDAIITFIITHLASHDIFFKEFKYNLEDYYFFISENINVHNKTIIANPLTIFLIMHETFITNDFWMMFPKKNKHFITYAIGRIFQTIDEGKELMIDKFKKKSDVTDKINVAKNYHDTQYMNAGKIDSSIDKSLSKIKNYTDDYDKYNIINDKNYKTYAAINFLDNIKKKSDKNPFLLYRQIRNLWEHQDGKNKKDKYLFILAAAKKGITQFILLTVIRELPFKDMIFKDSSEENSSGPTMFIDYLVNNLTIITKFLNKGIDDITGDSYISNSNKKRKLLKHIWAEFQIHL